jgi:Tfp pilus assembly protein PilN
MKAVNLIPSDQRRGGGGSSLATNALLGALALVLVGVVAYVLTSNQISSRKDDLAKAKQRNATVTSELSALKPYVDFASLKESRSKTVHDLAAARFNWQRAMGDLSHVTTHQVWLTAMTATVAPGVALESGGTGATSTLRGALPNPAVEISGCAVSNKAVVAYMSRLRAMKNVVRVSLDSAEKSSDSAGGSSTSTSTGGGSGAQGCGSGDSTPAFTAVVFFAPTAGATDAAAATGATGTTPAPATGTSTSTSTSTSSGTTSNTSNTSGSTR